MFEWMIYKYAKPTDRVSHCIVSDGFCIYPAKWDGDEFIDYDGIPYGEIEAWALLPEDPPDVK